MMDAINALSSARVSSPAELTPPQNRVETPKPAGAPERQAEAAPSVSVQISSAAREVAARENASAAQDTNAAPPPPPQRPPAASDAATDSSGNTASPQSAQVRQALQLFSDNAGSGVAQSKPSPLRASA